MNGDGMLENHPYQNGVIPTLAVEKPINPAKRLPMLLLIDKSSSIAPVTNQLNKALEDCQKEILNNPQALVSTDLGIVEFGSDAQLTRPFSNVDEEAPMPIISANGVTNMGMGINLGIDQLVERQKWYKQETIPSWRPIMLLITDGEPTDEWQAAASRLRKLQQQGKLTFYAIGYAHANMEVLQQLSLNPPARLQETKFREFFIWVSKLASIVSNSGDSQKIAPPPINAWGELHIS